MGIHDFNTIFAILDKRCIGYISAEQIYDYFNDVSLSTLSYDQVEAALVQVCGKSFPKHVSQELFLEVMEELYRRQSIEEQAYWDFQALDYSGSNHIQLTDAFLLFQEFHGDKFSLDNWFSFLESREDADAGVYFDEIRLWLCNYPSGEPARDELIIKEQERLRFRQEQHQLKEIDMLKKLQDTTEETEEYRDLTMHHVKRKLNKWKKFGVGAVINDDGLDTEEDAMETVKDYLTMNDVVEAMEYKYDYLREKIFSEMASSSAAVESEKLEIFQQISSQERQLRRTGKLEKNLMSLPGSQIVLRGTVLGLMGEIEKENKKRLAETDALRNELKGKGLSEAAINAKIQQNYQDFIAGDRTCGSALVQLYQRQTNEKEALVQWLRSGQGESQLSAAYSHLYRQCLLTGDEAKFVAAAVAVGLAERPQQYKSSVESDWDRSRAEMLSQLRLSEKKGRKPLRTSKDFIDVDAIESKGKFGVLKEFIMEMVRKHNFEREALIDMLQGRDSENYKNSARKLSSELREKHLKTLRNRHKRWKESRQADSSIALQLLQEATGLYFENCTQQMRHTNSKVSGEEVNAHIMADLLQRQEVEFREKLVEYCSKNVRELMTALHKENKSRVLEHYDNIAYVLLGTVEILEEDKEYLNALQKKYSAIRDQILIMGQKNQDWTSLSSEEKKKELKVIRKEEKRLRGEGLYDEMEALIGPRGKTLHNIRKLIGEEKHEFVTRIMRQKMTGSIEDEVPADMFSSINHLADLISRYDNEEDALLSWLHSDGAKKQSLRTQELQIVLLEVETFFVKMEEDFEIASLGLGLLERIEAALLGRHSTDLKRRERLSQRRIQIRHQKLLQKDADKHVQKTVPPSHGNIRGWEVALCSEMLLRHGDERELLLQFLQDESLEDLIEAATDLTDAELKMRLAELHSKRRQLNLDLSDDVEENVSILEEAVALRFVCKRKEMVAGAHRPVSLEEVIVKILEELQEEQEKELATLLGLLTTLSEEELRNRYEDEQKARKQNAGGNVFVILTQSESKAHEIQLLKALDDKYTRLQECVAFECLQSQKDPTEWGKMSEKEKQSLVQSFCQQIQQQRISGSSVGLYELMGSTMANDYLSHIIACHRQQFLVAVRQNPDEEHLPEIDMAADRRNVLVDLWQRFDDEKRNLMKALKGLEEDYMSEIDQQVHVVRLNRERVLASRTNIFTISATLVGLAERQMVQGLPSLARDRERYMLLAKELLENGKMTKSNFKFESSKSADASQLMDSLCSLLEQVHVEEIEFFQGMLASKFNTEQAEEIVMLSQQQKKDRLLTLTTQREALPTGNRKDHMNILEEALLIQRELCRHRLNNEQKTEADNMLVHQNLMADLLLEQNCHCEQIFQGFKEMDADDLGQLQTKLLEQKKMQVVENVAKVLLRAAARNADTDVEEALASKYDALRDKLLLEALMKQYGESEWKRMSELERQKKLMELKLKERQLRKEGKLDELAKIFGDAFEEQETLRKLLGDTKEEQERKLKERLEKRKKRLAQGMSEDEVNRLEKEEIAEEEEIERKRRRNILTELDHEYEKEKAELLRRLAEGDDKLLRERDRQLELMRLRRDERRARQEDRFDSAALVIGLAKEREEKMKEQIENEKDRQKRLAKDRLEAARRKKQEGQTQKEEPDVEISIETDDKLLLKEAVTIALDKRHGAERDLLIQLMEENESSDLRMKVKNMSAEERLNRYNNLRFLRAHWRDLNKKDEKEQVEIFREAVCIQMEILLDKFKEENLSVEDEEVKIQLLTELQELQDNESNLIFKDFHNKDAKTLQEMVMVQRMLQKEAWNDNIALVLLGKTQKKDDEEVEEDLNQSLVDALEQKYDVLKEKLMEASLKKELGEDNWNKLSDMERQQLIIERKLKEKQLREEGKDEEALQLFGDLSDDNEILNSFMQDDKSEEEKEADREKRKDELRKKREMHGLEVDDDTLNDLIEKEEKQKRRNVLEHLQNMFEDEKAALLRQLEEQKDRVAQERDRQLAIAKLRRDKMRMKNEEKLDSVALIFSMANEADEKLKQNIDADRERQRALAKERLEARRRKLGEKKGKEEEENLEEKMKADDEAAGIEEMTSKVKDRHGLTVHEAILNMVDHRQTDERNLLLQLFEATKKDIKGTEKAKSMTTEELKTELSKLEMEQTKWRKQSQQICLTMDEGTVNKALWEKHYKQLADLRKAQQAILSQALLYKLQLQEENLRQSRPDMTDEQIQEELNISILADLQEKQNTENHVIQSLIQQQDADGLDRLKKLQRTARRAGWYDSLPSVIFQMSVVDGDEEALNMFEKMKNEMEEEMEKQRQALIENAKRRGDDIDIDAALKELEAQQAAKRRAMSASLTKQQQALRDKIAARKRKEIEKEEGEIEAQQLILMAESQKKADQERIQAGKSRHSSKLQERLLERKLARKRKAEEAQEKLQQDENNLPTTPVASWRSTESPQIPFGLKREKTVVDVNITDADSQAVFSKLVREQTTVNQKKSDQLTLQKENLRRQIEARKGKKQEKSMQLIDQGERNKASYLKKQEEEKSRQMMLMKEKISKRARSRSPHKAIEESPKHAGRNS